MPYLDVRVVDEDDNPVSGAQVGIAISHSFTPGTHLTEYTDSDGIAHFEFDSGVSADVFVRGNLALNGVGLDDEVTVTI